MLWFGGPYGGVNVFDKTTKTFTNYTNNPKDPDNLRGVYPPAFLEDSEGSFWIETGAEFCRFSTGKRGFV